METHKSMKKLILLPFIILFLLSNCTETIYDEVIRIDTVWLERAQSLAPTFVTTTDTVFITDTVSVEVIVTEVDTVFKVITRDSIIIKEVEKIIYHTDTLTIVETDTVEIIRHDTVTLTIYDRTISYRDTFWVIDPFNMVTFVPNELQPYVTEFHQSCLDRGIFVNGMPLLVQYTNNLPGESWNSFSYVVGFQQLIIELNEKLPPEQQRAGILRELNRLQRNKKYVTDVNKIMCPLWSPARIITTQDLDELYK